MIDRYTKVVLTLIAATLLYIAIIVTPLPVASAQQPSLRPGESSGPTEVVIVGWRPGGREPVPVVIQQAQPLRIEGNVTTERSTSRVPDRMVLVGWEQNAQPNFPQPMRGLSETSRIPVALPPPREQK